MITTITLNVSVDKAYHINETVESGKVIRVAVSDSYEVQERHYHRVR